MIMQNHLMKNVFNISFIYATAWSDMQNYICNFFNFILFGILINNLNVMMVAFLQNLQIFYF